MGVEVRVTVGGGTARRGYIKYTCEYINYIP